jgi:hypothetical protein
MRQFRSGDAWVDGEVRRAEEALALARALTAEGRMLQAREVLAEGLTARPAFPCESRPPRRPARVWLGSVLLAVGHRLLRTSPRPAAPA